MVSTILLIIAAVLFVLAAFASHISAGGVTGRVHLGWLGLALFATAHLSL